jgi:hypothetical protein
MLIASYKITFRGEVPDDEAEADRQAEDFEAAVEAAVAQIKANFAPKYHDLQVELES